MPRIPPSEAASSGGVFGLGAGAINPSGCWMTETRSSTAVAAAMDASPGLVTVHIWSSVRSVKLCNKIQFTKVEFSHSGMMAYVCWGHNVVAVITSQSLMSSRSDLSSCTMPHHEVSVETERRIEDDLKIWVRLQHQIKYIH